jgi:hypothetical protein
MKSRVWAAVVASAVILSGCGWFGPTGPPDIPSGPRLVAAAYACPAAGTTVDTTGSPRLPRGALAARICRTTDSGPSWLPPRDDLTTRVARLVRLVDRLRISGRADPTTMLKDTGYGGPSNPVYAIVVRYADGTRTVSSGQCDGNTLRVGQALRAGSMRVWHRYFRLLAAQRRAGARPAGRRQGTCDSRSAGFAVTPLFDVHALVAAQMCPLDRRNRPLAHGVRRLDRAQLQVLRAELLRPQHPYRQSPRLGCMRWHAAEHYMVSVVDALGDRAVLFGQCRTYARARPVESLRIPVIRPLPTTARMWQRLLEPGRR